MSALSPDQRKRGEGALPDEVVAIMKGVAGGYCMTVADILSHRRDMISVEARWQAVIAVAEAFPTASYPQLGRWFGRDHTSILHIIRRMWWVKQRRAAVNNLHNSEQLCERAAIVPRVRDTFESRCFETTTASSSGCVEKKRAGRLLRSPTQTAVKGFETRYPQPALCIDKCRSIVKREERGESKHVGRRDAGLFTV